MHESANEATSEKNQSQIGQFWISNDSFLFQETPLAVKLLGGAKIAKIENKENESVIIEGWIRIVPEKMRDRPSLRLSAGERNE